MPTEPNDTVDGEVISRELVPVLDSRQTLALQLRDDTKLNLLREMNPDLTQYDFELLLEKCRSTGLNPFKNEIYAIVRGKGDNRKVTFQTSIEGYRKIAFESGQYDGMEGPWWCGEDGVWKDIWLSPEPPMAAKVKLYRKDVARGFDAVALWSEYAQKTQIWENRQPTGEYRLTDMWATKGASMLAKCAESLGYRKMAPNLYGGVYTAEEMMQSDNEDYVQVESPADAAKRRKALGSATAKAETNAQAREQQARQHNEAPPNEPQATAPVKRTLEESKSILPEFTHPLLDVLYSEDKTPGAMKEIIGGPVTPKALRAWEEQVTNEGHDPAHLLMERARKLNIIKPVDLDAVLATPAVADDGLPPRRGDVAYARMQAEKAQAETIQAVNPETAEVIEVAGDAVPDGYEVVQPDDDDSLPFE